MINSIELEKRLLGVSFFKKEYAKIVTESLDPDCFTDTRNKVIFSAVKDLFEAEKEIDFLIVASYLKDKNRLKAAGEEEYIIEIQEDAFDVKDLKTLNTYIKEVSQNKYVSQIIQLSEEYKTKIKDTLELDSTVSSFKEELDEISKKITTNTIDIDFKKAINKTVAFLGSEPPTPVKTYIYTFDEIFSSFFGGTLTTIAGKTGLGKSAFATNIAVKNAINKIPTLIFSLEMSEVEITTRIFSLYSRIQENEDLHMSLDELKTCRNDIAKMNKLSQLAAQLYDYPIYILDGGLLSRGDFRIAINILRYYINFYGIKFVIIDYLQLLDYSSSDINNRARALAKMSRGFKGLATELDIPVVILSQLSREADKADRPRRYHLRESGSIEHDSDNIILLHSEQEEPSLIEEITIIVEKQRAGRIGDAKAEFDKRYSFFSDVSQQWIN